MRMRKQLVELEKQFYGSGVAYDKVSRELPLPWNCFSVLMFVSMLVRQGDGIRQGEHELLFCRTADPN